MKVNQTYEANTRRHNKPAEFPPEDQLEAHHRFEILIILADTIDPGDGNDFEEYQIQQCKTGGSKVVEYLEPVHAALYDEHQADEIRDCTDSENEHFFARSQMTRPLVDDGGEEALHRTELTVQTEHDDHQEEQTRPHRR